ncbi:MAG: hypothetical protein RPU37_00490 [Candidatus Sedimenticola sp. (ex Thyasira tokunagai)]
MRLIKHLTTWLLLLTVLTASGVVSAKVASGSQNLSGGLYQGNVTANALTHQAKIEFSYDGASGSPVATKSVTPNTAQLKNINRFQKKIPANAKENIQTHRLPSDGIAVQATSPGRVPGSKAVYEKQINAPGKTTQYTKTTYDPQGNIVHVKDKINGGVFP